MKLLKYRKNLFVLTFIMGGSFCLFSSFTLASKDNNQHNFKRGGVSKTLSLKQAQEIALKQHPEIISSDYHIQAADEAIQEEQSNLYPQIAGSATGATARKTTHVMTVPGTITAPTVFGSGSYGVSACQLITDFGRTGYLVDAAQLTRDAFGAKSLGVKGRIVLIVTQAYYNVLRSQKILEVAKATLKERQSFLDQMTALRASEIKSDLDVSLAQQNLDDANLLLLKSQNDLDDAYTELSEALGYGERIYFQLSSTVASIPSLPDLGGSLKKALSVNPEVREIKAKLSAARNQYNAEKAAFFPTVSAVGYAGESPVRNKALLPRSYAAAGVNVSIPLYTGGRLTATEKRALNQTKAIEQDLVRRENQLFRDVRLSWNNSQTAYKSIAVTKEILQNSLKSLELMKSLYDLGKNSIVDLTQAQLNQTRAEIASTNAAYDFMIHLALLKYYRGESIE